MILSICISTYNPEEDFYNKITDLLSVNDERFEIVISDNKSTNGVIEKLKLLNNPKLKIFELDKNYGPTKNYVNALIHAQAKYAMFVTDKDSLNTEVLISSIMTLSEINPNFGYFELDSNIIGTKIKIYKKTKKCIKNLIYLSKHPTGYFYKTDLLKEMNIMEKFSDVGKVGYFPFEFICAEFAIIGNGAIIDNKLCVTAKPKENNAVVVSKTYSQKNKNLFFDPEHCLSRFFLYYTHSKTLKTSIINKFNILKILIKNLFYKDIKFYSIVVGDAEKARYYQFEQKILTKTDLMKIAKDFQNAIQKSKKVSIIDKIIINYFVNKKVKKKYK